MNYEAEVQYAEAKKINRHLHHITLPQQKRAEWDDFW